jgi:hypothetical protein
MTHEKCENEIIGAKDAEGVTNADTGNPAAAADSAARGRRGAKSPPKQAGEGETTDTSDQHDPKPVGVTTDPGSAAGPAPSKLDLLVALLRAPGGATLPEMQSATGWQAHSVRGAMGGALRKKGYSVTSEKLDGELRRYRIAEAS